MSRAVLSPLYQPTWLRFEWRMQLTSIEESQSPFWKMMRRWRGVSEVKLSSQSGNSSMTVPICDPGEGRPVRDPEAGRFTGLRRPNRQWLVWPWYETGVILGLQKEHLMFLSHWRYRNHTINWENTISDSKFTNIRGRRSTMGHIKISRTRTLEGTLVYKDWT
jgi:hypothetical protein